MLAHDMASHALFFVWALISPAWDTYLNSSALNLNVINVYDVAITGRVATKPNLKRTSAGQIQGAPLGSEIISSKSFGTSLAMFLLLMYCAAGIQVLPSVV